MQDIGLASVAPAQARPYNGRVDVDGVRMACPACGARLVVMPRARYVACKRCESEYAVQQQGNTVGLQPFAPREFELSRQIADVEKSQGEGCTNVFFWVFLVAGIFFCGAGYLSRALFQTSIPLVVGWAISLAALIVAAITLLRMLNAQRAHRQRLEAERRELFDGRADKV